METKESHESNRGPRHVEEVVSVSGNEHFDDSKRLREDATLATEDEHNTTFLQAVKRYPKAAFWSAVVSLCIIMDGYDTALMGGLYVFPAFKKQYGFPKNDGSGEYGLNASWQVALGMGATIGNIIGVIMNGYLTDHFGHKKTLQGSLVALTGFIFITFFAPSMKILFVGQIFCGIPWGIFSTMAPAYASEVAPVVLRSYLETWVVTCWGLGQFFSYAVLFTLNNREGHWAYRIPFGVQWVWPVIIMPLAIFFPESPWWLVRKNRYNEAEKSIMRLTSAPNKEIARGRAKKALALMIETNQLEEDVSEDTSFLACFKGTDLRRTEIAAFAWGAQTLTGFVIQGLATYFFNNAGLSSENSFKMTLGIGGIHLSCNLVSTAVTGNYGRRKIFLVGCVGLTILMFVIAGLAFGPTTTSYGFATSAVYLIWFAVWEFSIGPLAYIINGEVSSTRLRSKTIAIARASYNILGIINSVAGPYILNEDYGNWRGKCGFLTGGLTILCFIWAYFRLPETRDRTYEELDVLFAEKDLAAKDFAKAVIRRDMDGIRVIRG